MGLSIGRALPATVLATGISTVGGGSALAQSAQVNQLRRVGNYTGNVKVDCRVGDNGDGRATDPRAQFPWVAPKGIIKQAIGIVDKSKRSGENLSSNKQFQSFSREIGDFFHNARNFCDNAGGTLYFIFPNGYKEQVIYEPYSDLANNQELLPQTYLSDQRVLNIN